MERTTYWFLHNIFPNILLCNVTGIWPERFIKIQNFNASTSDLTSLRKAWFDCWKNWETVWKLKMKICQLSLLRYSWVLPSPCKNISSVSLLPRSSFLRTSNHTPWTSYGEFTKVHGWAIFKHGYFFFQIKCQFQQQPWHQCFNLNLGWGSIESVKCHIKYIWISVI